MRRGDDFESAEVEPPFRGDFHEPLRRCDEDRLDQTQSEGLDGAAKRDVVTTMRSPESAVSHVPPSTLGDPTTTIGPIGSGRIDAIISVCQPAWQLAMTIGLLSAAGSASPRSSKAYRTRARWPLSSSSPCLRLQFARDIEPRERHAEQPASHRAITGHVSLSVREPMKRPMCPPGASFFSIRPLGVPTRFSAANTWSLVVMSSLSPARR